MAMFHYELWGAYWTAQEIRTFERALSDFDESSRDFFENVASRLPDKSVADVKRRYAETVDNVELIEKKEDPSEAFQNADEEIEAAKREYEEEMKGKKGGRRRGRKRMLIPDRIVRKYLHGHGNAAEGGGAPVNDGGDNSGENPGEGGASSGAAAALDLNVAANDDGDGEA